MSKRDIVIMAELDWGGLHCQSHVVARGFAAEGHRVFYINRTLQRWPKWRHLVTRLMPSPSRGIQSAADVPQNIVVVNLWVGPPLKQLRALNFALIKRKIKTYEISDPVLITYVPTYNFIDLREILKPELTAYICYHNFDADIVLPDLLLAEKEIIMQSDLLFGDSKFLVQRVKSLSGGKVVHQAPPGVYFENFSQAYRGDEWIQPRKVCYFGGVGNHIDIDCYNYLSNFYEIFFIGVINPDVRNRIDKRIKIIDAVSNNELPDLLKEMDVLTMLYMPSSYMDGVLPAKFFECIATGKPILVSGIPESLLYSEHVYDTGNDAERALNLIKSLPAVHSLDKVNMQFVTGRNADFKNRFMDFKKHFRDSLEL